MGDKMIDVISDIFSCDIEDSLGAFCPLKL